MEEIMPSKICPFISNSQGTELNKIQCIGNECQFFYDEPEQCGLNEIVDYLDMMNTTLMMK